MKKNVLMRLCMLALSLAMVLSLFACGPEEETTAGTDDVTTEAPSNTETDPKDNTETDPKDNTETDPKDNTETDPKDNTETDPKDNTETDPKDNTETDPKDNTETDPKDNTETDPKDNTETEPDDDEPLCGYVHDYASNKEGHWKPACEHCGKAEGSVQSHVLVNEEIDNLDGTVIYKTYCEICGYVDSEITLDEDIYYFGPEKFGLNGTNMDCSVVVGEDGITYAHCVTKGATENVRWNVMFNGASSTPQDVNVGKSQYAIIKAKVNATNPGGVKLSIGTMAAAGRFGRNFGAVTYSDEWTVYVVDITNLYDGTKGIGYLAGPDGTYSISTMFIINQDHFDWKVGESLDIAYMAFVETLDDVKSVVTDEAYWLVGPTETDAVYKNTQTGENMDPPAKPEETQPAETAPAETAPAETDPAGTDPAETDPAETAPAETDPVEGNVVELGPEHFNFDGHTNMTSELKDENGMSYVRCTATKNAWMMFLNGASGASQNLAVGNAKYVVIKARADKNDNIKFSIDTATSPGRLAVGYTGAQYSTDWAIYVIDLSNHNDGTKGYLPNADGTYTIDTMCLGSWNSSWTAGQYLDIAYMAFIEDLDSLKDLVTEDTYTLLGPGTVGDISTTVSQKVTIDREEDTEPEETQPAETDPAETDPAETDPAETDPAETAPAETDPAETDPVEGNVVELGPEHFNYNHTNMTSELKDENGMSYVRCTATNNAWMMFLNGASGASQNLAVGNAKYVVIKARADKNDIIKFSIDTATSPGRWAVGYTGAKYSTDWAIYVIDLSNHNDGTKGYLPNADGTYTIDTMCLGSWNSWTAGQYLDIAYMAFIEDLDSLKDLVTEDAYTLLGPGAVGATPTNVAEEKTIDRE